MNQVAAATTVVQSSDGAGGAPAPYFFTPSTLKLVLMSLCTLGLYELYWFYKNWVLIKTRTREDLMPFWRTFFAPLWAYSFFKQVKLAAEENQVSPPPAIGWLAAAFFIVQALWRLPDPYWIVSMLSFVPLLPANVAALAVNRKIQAQGFDNARFTAWNWVALVLGGLLFVCAIIGAFLPAEG